MARILPIDPAHPGDALAAAAKAMKRGGAVVYPTDTFWGLGTDASDPAAVSAIYAIKARAAGVPLPVLVESLDGAMRIVEAFPQAARRLAEAFWPGRLTLVLPAAPAWNHVASADGTLGVRVPDHFVARELSRLVGGPVVGTSANRSGQPTPADAESIEASIGGSVEIILDGGALSPSRGSTVVVFTEDGCRVLREGDLSIEEIGAVVPIR